MRLKLSLNDACIIAKVRGGSCLSDKFINGKSPLLWRCAIGHEWNACFTSVVYKKTWCPYCAGFGGVRLTLEDTRKIACDRNGECLSKKFINANLPLLWRCSKGHEWNARFSIVKNQNSWCPFCCKYKREKICHGIVSKYLGPPSSIRRPDFLKTLEHPTGLELDIYYPEFGFAIEVQGKQHKHYIRHFHRTPEGFNKMLARDQLKKELCEENNIYLFYIWYDDKDPQETIRKELYNLGLID
ncbi:2243_t:CDS:1 [Entrophospora sp. SA101]|nr:10292_t:CDS:1 [Entrophospora sp. SA101]CAJ0835258.1 1693_t:CDS:1 [Entrophospora sp. SA101]CAJ0848377.1 2243_t:CDS:1 [Entrophospora sp. SA101]CAJ0874804.1 4960_t:CDS:1 [Entrophospora sp. SA101]CAJ0921719.1 7993_t:CDS:1 [Entrophospora sp. SA101]